MPKKHPETFCPTSKKEWRLWLIENHDSKQSVWLVYSKLKTGIPSITWSEAVEEALCFGWIDSTKRPIDHEKFMQLFSIRKTTSTWSKINKEKAERLILEGAMMGAGYKSIEAAKQNGSWNILDEVEDLKIPKDLDQLFKKYRGSKKYFTSLSKSVRKAILQWLVLAKRPETRQKRMIEIAELAAQNLKPKQFR